MNYRTLGRTGWQVSEIGFGGWGIGAAWWGTTDDSESLAAVGAAAEAGINFFDTAYVYGDGHSEELIGRALKNKDVLIATKIPPKNQEWPPKPQTPAGAAFPPEWIFACTERSLAKLGRETTDLTQFHVWTDAWLSDDNWKEAVAKLKKQGKIRAFGVSINDHDPDSALKLVASGLVDTVQVIFNIFDQSPTRRLFPLCEKHNVGVIARVPFDEGSLTGTFTETTKFEKGDFRAQYFGGDNLAKTLARVEKLKPLLSDETKTLSELGLKFVLSQLAVSTVIPGMRRAKHVAANAAVAGRRLPPQTVKELEKHAWQRNFYGWWND